jgi:hypothetical protein
MGTKIVVGKIDAIKKPGALHSRLLATFLAQTLGLALEAIGRWWQMAVLVLQIYTFITIVEGEQKNTARCDILQIKQEDRCEPLTARAGSVSICDGESALAQ